MQQALKGIERVRWQPAAIRDRITLVEQAYAADPESARHLDAALDQEVQAVRRSPLAGGAVDVNLPDTRQALLTPGYFLIYTVRQGALVVLRLLPSQSRWRQAQA